MVQLHDLAFSPYISERKIHQAITVVAAKLNKDLADKNPVFVGVLNGCVRFAAAIMDQFEHPGEFTFVKVSSYDGVRSTGSVREQIGLQQNLKGRTVVLLEDIVDSGTTVASLYKLLQAAECAQVEVATLFFKPSAYKKDIKIKYVGLEIPDVFIVGFGLDYRGLGRNLNEIYQLNTTKRMTNLVLFGPPGAGKGTQAEVLKEKYSLVHISTGDVFRFNIKNATTLGTLAKTYIDKGQLVPDSVTIDMLRAEVDKNPEAKGFIFDGFPRTEAQADALEVFLSSKNTAITAMIALEVDDEVLVSRLLERGKTSGRADDADDAVIRNRIKVYYDETAILKNYYQKLNKYSGVDGMGTIAEITERLSATIDQLKTGVQL